MFHFQKYGFGKKKATKKRGLKSKSNCDWIGMEGHKKSEIQKLESEENIKSEMIKGKKKGSRRTEKRNPGVSIWRIYDRSWRRKRRRNQVESRSEQPPWLQEVPRTLPTPLASSPMAHPSSTPFLISDFLQFLFFHSKLHSRWATMPPSNAFPQNGPGLEFKVLKKKPIYLIFH